MATEERTVEGSVATERLQDVIRKALEAGVFQLPVNGNMAALVALDAMVDVQRDLRIELAQMRIDRDSLRKGDLREVREDSDRWRAKANELEAKLRIYEEEIERRDARSGFGRRGWPDDSPDSREPLWKRMVEVFQGLGRSATRT